MSRILQDPVYMIFMKKSVFPTQKLAGSVTLESISPSTSIFKANYSYKPEIKAEVCMLELRTGHEWVQLGAFLLFEATLMSVVVVLDRGSSLSHSIIEPIQNAHH